MPPIADEVDGSISRALIDQYGDDVRFTDPFAADKDCKRWMFTPDMLAIFCSDDIKNHHELLNGAIPSLDVRDFLPPVFTLDSPEEQLH